MSVYKELIYAAAEVQRKSVRIFEDACDYGVPVYSFTDSIILLVKSIIDQYRAKVETSKYSTGATQIITVEGLDEWNTGKEFTVKFGYVTTKGVPKKMNRGGMKGYLWVENGFEELGGRR